MTEDRFLAASPVGSFPLNGYGLCDMTGNMWNCRSDYHRDDIHAQEAGENSCFNPQRPTRTRLARNPRGGECVTKGGSFSYHPSYGEGSRPGARRERARVVRVLCRDPDALGRASHIQSAMSLSMIDEPILVGALVRPAARVAVAVPLNGATRVGRRARGSRR